jgi:hypothetical protein
MIFSLFSVRAHQIARLVRARRLRTRRCLDEGYGLRMARKVLDHRLGAGMPKRKIPRREAQHRHDKQRDIVRHANQHQHVPHGGAHAVQQTDHDAGPHRNAAAVRGEIVSVC